MSRGRPPARSCHASATASAPRRRFAATLVFVRRGSGGGAPREIAFSAFLPKTRSGKIMRRVLKARETGAPEGDLSALEPEPGGKAA